MFTQEIIGSPALVDCLPAAADRRRGGDGAAALGLVLYCGRLPLLLGGAGLEGCQHHLDCLTQAGLSLQGAASVGLKKPTGVIQHHPLKAAITASTASTA